MSQKPDIEISEADFQDKQNKLDVYWESRHLFESLNSFIDIAEYVSRSRFRDFKTMLRLSRAYRIRAEYFDHDFRLRLRDWEQAANWAEKTMTLDPVYRNAVINLKRAPEEAMVELKGAELDALYWYATNLGKRSAVDRSEQGAKNRLRVRKIVDYLAQVAPDINYGAVYRYYGAYQALQPNAGRAELDASRKNFEAAVTKFPDYFLNHTLYAAVYAAKIKDAALAEKQYRFVIKANPASIKDFNSEQILEQKRAVELLRSLK
ncbi:MAG: hypothetical protein JST80_07935 [Bdellovibrionales bacterium]|nr:hypothetical protein [Bdellovibrionales bacterium]